MRYWQVNRKTIQTFISGIIISAMISLSGCAISPTYGEKDLSDYEKDYGTSSPIDPQYKLSGLGGNLYSLTLHQGSVLISPGHVRAEYLRQAAIVIANKTCVKDGKQIDKTEFKRSGDSGWVHLQGTFTCVETQARKTPEKDTNINLATGTGFFVTTQGHIITAFHVVDDAKSIAIKTEGGQFYDAVVIRSDPANDLALLKINVLDSSPVRIKNPDNIEKGDEVLALGYPLLGLQGQEQKATFGHVNALSGPMGDFRFFQIDATIQPGNSRAQQARIVGNLPGGR